MRQVAVASCRLPDRKRDSPLRKIRYVDEDLKFAAAMMVGSRVELRSSEKKPSKQLSYSKEDGNQLQQG